MPRILVKLGPNGEIAVTVDGEKGSGCVEKTSYLQRVFGEQMSFEEKGDYYESKVCEGNAVKHGLCG